MGFFKIGKKNKGASAPEGAPSKPLSEVCRARPGFKIIPCNYFSPRVRGGGEDQQTLQRNRLINVSRKHISSTPHSPQEWGESCKASTSGTDESPSNSSTTEKQQNLLLSFPSQDSVDGGEAKDACDETRESCPQDQQVEPPPSAGGSLMCFFSFMSYDGLCGPSSAITHATTTTKTTNSTSTADEPEEYLATYDLCWRPCWGGTIVKGNLLDEHEAVAEVIPISEIAFTKKDIGLWEAEGLHEVKALQDEQTIMERQKLSLVDRLTRRREKCEDTKPWPKLMVYVEKPETRRRTSCDASADSSALTTPPMAAATPVAC